MHTDPGIALLSALAASHRNGHVRVLLDSDSMAGRRRRSSLCRSGLHAVCFAGRSDADSARYHYALWLCAFQLSLIYQFFILPAITGFELLSVVLAFALIPAGLLMAIPAYAPIGLALALAFCIEMSLQTSYTADLATIINSNSAFVLGGVAGLVGDAADERHRHAGQCTAADTGDVSRSGQPCRRPRASDARRNGPAGCSIASPCCCIANHGLSLVHSTNSPMRSKICGSASI